jgi:outer membrane protein insertion porin family
MQLTYRNAGYASATVDYQIKRDEGLMIVTFLISEGPRVMIRAITFFGNDAVDRDSLLLFFEKDRSGLFGRGELPFVQSNVEAAVDEIRQRYITLGYLDVVVEGPRLTFVEDRSRVDISVIIREGLQYRIQRIDIRGDVLPDALDDLDSLRRKMIGQPYFNRRKLMLQTQLLEIYGNRGYPDTEVDVNRQPPTEPGQVLLDVLINSGPFVTISGIEVRGNKRTRTSFIRNRMRLKPGAPYNLDLQKESFRDLYKTGIFSKVDFQLEKSDVPGKRVLVVMVEEAPAKELYFEPGWGSYELLRLRVGFREKNLFGTGRIFGSEATGSAKARSLLVRLSDPFFLNTDIRADLDTFYNHRIEPSFTREDIGMSFSLIKDLTDNLMTTAKYTIRKTDISNTDNVEDKGSDQNYDFASLGIQANYDTRNDLFFPTEGQRTFAALEQADQSLGSDVNFTRLTGGARFFFRLAQNTVLGLRYTSGLIIPTRDQVTIPLAERFFNGGENTVRSFKESELGPRDTANDPAGGYGFNVFNIELRRRIIGNFTGSLFFDYGNVSPNRARQEQGKPPYDRRSDVISDTLNDFFKGFRPGVGFGFQYQLPVGPARIDFAFNPDRDKRRDEDFFVFHFAVGMAF